MVDLVSPELGADADSAKNMIKARLLGDYLRRGIVSDESHRELIEMIVHGQGEVAEAYSLETTLPISANAVAIREANAFLLEDAVADGEHSASFARHHVIRWYADGPLCVGKVMRIAGTGPFSKFPFPHSPFLFFCPHPMPDLKFPHYFCSCDHFR